jgi:two-component system OmpR family response regulator
MGDATILIVEDDRGIRDSLSVALQAEGHQVVALEDGRLLDSHLSGVDLAVIDVHLPVGPDGLSMTRRIRQTSDVPIIILTAAGDLEQKGAGYRAGADQYVAKPFSVTELLWQIAALLRRAGRVPTAVKAGRVSVDPDAYVARYEQTELRLTPTEFALLHALARDRGKAVSKARLLANVWGHTGHEVNLVETNVRRLRGKLDEHQSGLIETVRGVSYRLRS